MPRPTHDTTTEPVGCDARPPSPPTGTCVDVDADGDEALTRVLLT